MAGQLVNWNFNAAQNRFTFYTDSRVQPTAQLIPNPTRIVVDLPGTTLSGPTIRQPAGGKVREIRIGEPDSFTTRVVIELDAGYTVDPQKVKVRGITPTQWVVELPTPELAPPSPPATPSPDNPPGPQSRGPADPDINQHVQVTANGLFVRLQKNGNSNQLRIKPNSRQQTVEFDLGGAVLPEGLSGQSLPINELGISAIQFSDQGTNPRLSLTLEDGGVSWNAYYSRVGGGIVLLPKQDSRSQGTQPPPRSESVSANAGSPMLDRSPQGTTTVSQAQWRANRNLATITSIDITRDDSQLLIRGDRQITARGTLNRLTGNYEIRIDRAQLAQQFQGPELARNGPVYQLNIRQETPDTVLVIVQPGAGKRFGRLFRSGGTLYALELLADASAPRPGNLPSVRPVQSSTNNDKIPIAIIPPPLGSQPSLPPNLSSPPSLPPGNLPRVPQGSRLVFIDPGHGGKDPGAIGLGGVQEKDVIMPISKYVAQYLEQQGVKVLMARTSDYFISLQGRTDMANRAGADLFVSIHANSMGKGRPDVNGFEIYYHGSPGLSQAIHRNVIRSVDVKDRGVRKARFYVLRNSRMPSTLVETGFVTGYEDNAKLTNPAFQQQMAQAIARGILEYLQQR